MTSPESWEVKSERIMSKYPSVVDVDWSRIFQSDQGVLGKLINDIIRVSHAEQQESRRGKRANVERDIAQASLRKLQDLDYSEEEFVVTLRALQGTRSIRHLARRVGMSHSRIQRFLEGKAVPSSEDMAQIADAFGKDPSYFAEYRSNYVVGVVHRMMTAMPESSIVQYRKLKDMM